jgi:hypothetical protein
MKFKRIFNTLIGPTTGSEDSRRQQFILSTLLLGISILALTSLIRAAIAAAQFGPHYHGAPIAIIFIISIIFLGLYLVSRSRDFRIAAYLLVMIIGLAGFYCLYTWGITLPTGLLVLVLSIIMSGILINTRFSLIYAAAVSAGVLLLGYLETIGKTHPDMYWT